MIELLAQAPATSAGSSLLMTLGVIGGSVAVLSLTIKHVVNRRIHLNGSTLMPRDLCDERSGNIRETLERIEEKLDEVLEKT